MKHHSEEQARIRAARAGVRDGSTTKSHTKGPWAMSRRFRKAVLVAHVAVSVGWLGAASLMAMLGVLAARSSVETRPAVYEMLHMLDLAAMIPFSLGAVGTGLVLSIGTTWGLLRFYWVVAKMIVTLAIMLFAALHVSRMAVLAGVLISRDTHTDLTAVNLQIHVGALLVTAALLFNTALSIVKPWGRTPLGKTLIRPGRT